jgi:hypothetical protein
MMSGPTSATGRRLPGAAAALAIRVPKDSRGALDGDPPQAQDSPADPTGLDPASQRHPLLAPMHSAAIRDIGISRSDWVITHDDEPAEEGPCAGDATLPTTSEHGSCDSGRPGQDGAAGRGNWQRPPI